jgi:hypothetical protein
LLNTVQRSRGLEPLMTAAGLEFRPPDCIACVSSA